MQTLKASFRSGFVTLIAASLLAIFGAHDSHAEDKTFTVGTLQDPNTVFPYLQYSGHTSSLRSLLFPPILVVQPDGKIRCILCREAPEVEVKRDKKTKEPIYLVNLELKKDLSWGDGRDMTGEDIKFTLETMAKSPYPEGRRPVLPIARILLDKDQTRKIQLVLMHKRSDAFQLFAIALLPAHKKQAIEASLQKPEDRRRLMQDPTFAYGPFRIESLEDTRWKLSHHDKNSWEYTSETPLDIRFYKDIASLTAALEKEEIVQTLPDELDWLTYSQIKEKWPKVVEKYSAHSMLSATMRVLLVNLNSPLLVNPQLRQALYFSIDRSKINQTLYDKLGEEAEGLVPRPFIEKIDEHRPPSFQPKLAAQLLDAAGWKLGEGKFRRSENKTLSLTMNCTEERIRGGWTETLKQDLANQGIELKIELSSEEEYTKKILAHRRFQDLACARWHQPPLSVPNNIFHSLAIPTRENDYVGLNYSGWDQPIVNKILDSMMRETDTHHFAKLFGRLEKHFLSGLPAIPLVYQPRITLTKKQALNSDLQKDLASYPGRFQRNQQKGM